MNDDKNLLKELLTEAEILIYTVLLNKGQLTATKIASETNLNRSNLYRILENLSNKKLISNSISNKKRYFFANNPSKLKELMNQKIKSLKEKQNIINKLVFSMQKIQKKKTEKDTEFNVSVYAGIQEIKNVLDIFLHPNKGEIIYGIGYGGLFNKLFPEYWESNKRKRVARGIKFKGVLSMEKPRKPRHKLTYVRYADLKQLANMRIDFFRDIIIIFIIEENPKAIVIKNKEIANGMKAYFDFLWENAQEP